MYFSEILMGTPLVSDRLIDGPHTYDILSAFITPVKFLFPLHFCELVF